jgi:hypothetical protein
MDEIHFRTPCMGENYFWNMYGRKLPGGSGVPFLKHKNVEDRAISPAKNEMPHIFLSNLDRKLHIEFNSDQSKTSPQRSQCAHVSNFLIMSSSWAIPNPTMLMSSLVASRCQLHLASQGPCLHRALSDSPPRHRGHPPPRLKRCQLSQPVCS